MSEEPVVPEAADDAVTTSENAESTIPETSFVDASGNLQEGWQEEFVPEDFRGNPVYQTFSDLKGMAKQLGHQARLIARQGKGVMPPDDKSTPIEREAFYEAIGRPKTPEEYQIAIPEGLDEYYADATVQEARDSLHKAGLTQTQLDAVMALDAKRLQTGLAQAQEAQQRAHDEAEKTLRAKYGDAYEERIHIANRMVADNVTEADKPALVQVIGDNPVVADFLATIGAKFMESKLINAEASGAMSPSEVNAKMEELIQEQSAHPRMRTDNPERYKRMNAEINVLAEKLVKQSG